MYLSDPCCDLLAVGARWNNIDAPPGGTARYSCCRFHDGVLMREDPTITISLPSAANVHQLPMDISDDKASRQRREYL